MNIRLILILSLLSFNQIYAQRSSQLDTAISFPSIEFGIGFQSPGADLGKRFGTCNNLEFGLAYKHKTNIQFSAQGNFIFGNRVKERNILSAVETSTGDLINNGGELTNIIYDMRGFSIFGNIGYVFPVFSPNPNCGILIRTGVGILQHKIKLDYRDGDVPFLDEEYRKGYDRLSNGLAFNGFVGYQYLSNMRLINFYIGFDYIYATTTNKRGFNFDSGPDNKQRTDKLTGVKLGWILPLYKSVPNDFYYY